MLRQESFNDITGQTRKENWVDAPNHQESFLSQAAETESLRAAYMAAGARPGRVLSGNTIKGATKNIQPDMARPHRSVYPSPAASVNMQNNPSVRPSTTPSVSSNASPSTSQRPNHQTPMSPTATGNAQAGLPIGAKVQALVEQKVQARVQALVESKVQAMVDAQIEAKVQELVETEFQIPMPAVAPVQTAPAKSRLEAAVEALELALDDSMEHFLATQAAQQEQALHVVSQQRTSEWINGSVRCETYAIDEGVEETFQTFETAEFRLDAGEAYESSETEGWDETLEFEDDVIPAEQGWEDGAWEDDAEAEWQEEEEAYEEDSEYAEDFAAEDIDFEEDVVSDEAFEEESTEAPEWVAYDETPQEETVYQASEAVQTTGEFAEGVSEFVSQTPNLNAASFEASRGTSTQTSPFTAELDLLCTGTDATARSANSFRLPKFLVDDAKPATPIAKASEEFPVSTQNRMQAEAQKSFDTALPPVPETLFNNALGVDVSAGNPRLNPGVGTNSKNSSVENFADKAVVWLSQAENAAKISQVLSGLGIGKARLDDEQPRSFQSYLSEELPNNVQKTEPSFLEEVGPWTKQNSNGEMIWVKLFERPRLLLGLLGLGILGCSVYVALGYWWFGGNALRNSDAEAVTLLDVQDESAASANPPKSNFSNINSIQRDSARFGVPQAPSMIPAKTRRSGTLLAQASPMSVPKAGQASSGLEPLKFEPTGRPDPFAPLVSATGQLLTGAGNKPAEEKKDILANVHYTGFIGDINSKDKVAIIKVSDSLAGTSTQIKKVGESFTVDGELVVVKGFSKKGLQLKAQGESRLLDIQQYQVSRMSAAGSGSSASTSPSTGAAGGAGSTSSASNAKDPSNVSLSEPKG